ncbi:MAG: hypothetical protein ACPG7W_08740 [Paracoccaceae bacterium]
MTKEWRTCGACGNMYEGEFGECPKCIELHKKAKKQFIDPSVGGNPVEMTAENTKALLLACF